MDENLPTELLRNFVAIAEEGSMVRASQKTRCTQAALSLQMKKLSTLVRAPIFARHRNGVVLTDAGNRLMEYARGMLELNDIALTVFRDRSPPAPVRVGIIQDLSALLVSRPLARFKQLFPDATLRIKVGTSQELNSQFNGGLLDLVVTMGAVDDHCVGSVPVRWLGDPALARKREVPIAVMDAPCPFRDRMIAALDRAKKPYRIVLETPGAGVLGAAINAGLAITGRTLSLPFFDGTVATIEGMAMDPIGVSLRHKKNGPIHVIRLHGLIYTSLITLMRIETKEASSEHLLPAFKSIE